MPKFNAANKASALLANAINNNITLFSVDDASLFPDTPFLVTIVDDLTTEANREIVEVVSVSGNVFTEVIRGQEDTSPSTHPQGAFVRHRFTAGMFDDLKTYTDEGENEDWAGVKYKLIMIDGEAFMEVIDS